ncbi:topoisomerase DNA-binding C4 zinc finger domain-containing protein [Maioricimonas sp. JC845]|uniref:topoisomerase DNA-binding C4 zinc finger domain-containing protein n=1 Tax=Maioricimonas sp. JC845 TaxID=3232138 RepID=UPI00345B2BE1
MILDETNQYRPILEQDPPGFFDRVNDPWDEVPDLKDYNRHAFNRVLRAVQDLSRYAPGHVGANSQGVLILGEAGTGKTHLLMRIARNMSDSNHILFIRKPNNEEAVAQHIWANVVNSLSHRLPHSSTDRSQLDDLLAQVFSRVLISEFRSDIQAGRDVDQKRRWVTRLEEDPFNLFRMLGTGDRRQDNMERIRRLTLRSLQHNHPDVDQTIARVLITYCFVASEERKRLLLAWLAGNDVEESEAKQLGLPPSWVSVNESSSDVSTSQQREEQALRAIRTLGVLSTYYQPLILAFDQLEGLRDQPRLTARWGDVVREIFTMTPNFLVVTCIFPSLWETWFAPTLDQSVKERIAQEQVQLETFQPRHGFKMLAKHLEPAFVRHRLPTNIYPFADEDVDRLCRQATSPRSFIQAARSDFRSWLDGDETAREQSPEDTPSIVSQEAIDRELRKTLDGFEKASRKSLATEMVLEQDFFGRLCNVTQILLEASHRETEFDKATCGHFVMPPNLIVRDLQSRTAVCLAVMNSEGSSFAARIRNLNKCIKHGNQFDSLVMIRDRRCRRLGPRSQEHLSEVESQGGVLIHAGEDEISCLNAVYETLVAIEEHDLTVGQHEIDKRHLVGFLRNEGTLSRTDFFRHAGHQLPALAEVVAVTDNNVTASSLPAQDTPVSSEPTPGKPFPLPRPPVETIPASASGTSVSTTSRSSRVEVVIGDDVLASPHVGVLGELRDDHRKLGISLTKPQCLVVLGYMGSGKSYALGVLIENALLSQPGLIEQSRPMSVVAFNYRRNPQARFEHGGFALPNSRDNEVNRLAEKYGGHPDTVKVVNVFGYAEELPRRSAEYGSLATFPIQFRSNELSAEHWEILMKPPTREAEYMDIIRDIIQTLFYQERLTFKNLEQAIQTDERMSNMQRRRAMNRLTFAERWISDDRRYEWSDVLQEGHLNIVDLRMQAMEASEALKLCLIITDLVRRTKNGVNKVVVFDEAHEYVDCKELVGELENAITQIRHDGLSFVLASQFPERIPESVFKYLLTRFIFKLPNAKAINYVRKAAPNLQGLSPQRVSNLDLEQGLCFIQTDDDCTDVHLRVPQLLEVRPRCTLHGGATIRQVDTAVRDVEPPAMSATEFEFDEFEVELCPQCGEELVLRRSRSGPVMVCSAYPRCRYGRKV